MQYIFRCEGQERQFANIEDALIYAKNKIWKTSWEYAGALYDGSSEPEIYPGDSVQEFIDKISQPNSDPDIALNEIYSDLAKAEAYNNEENYTSDYVGIIVRCFKCDHEEDIKIERWALCTSCDKLVLLCHADAHTSKYHSQT